MTSARPAAGFADLTACDVVLTSLPDDDTLAAMTLGSEDLVRVLAPGAVHISTSTVSPDISRRVAEEHARRSGQVLFGVLPSSIEHIRAGKLRALAVTSAARSEALPDTPMVANFVQGYQASLWFGVGAPRNTPAAIIDKLNGEINAALADPNVWSGRASLEVFIDLSALRSCINVSGL